MVASPESPDLRTAAARALGVDSERLLGVRIHKKSLDARKKSRIQWVYQLHVDLEGESRLNLGKLQNVVEAKEKPDYDPLANVGPVKTPDLPPVIIGSGPAGSFAAHVLASAGVRSVLVERGEPVEKRFRTVNTLRRSGVLNKESNYCYGEGGAGTFSDGKLTCGRNHPLIRYLFQTWVDFGAPEDILYDAHPHIGTDILMQVAMQMRQFVLSQGSEYLFETRMTDIRPGKLSRYEIVLDDGTVLETNHLILAVGHSARETYKMLARRGIAIEQKPFAMGVRIEHPQEQINQIQYGSCGFLPPAEYKLTAQQSGRGIWTFCMCPGGHLLPTSTQDGHLAINGMSYHSRNSGFANAALVVGVNREDYNRGHALDGMHFQANLERKAFKAGGGDFFSPGQRVKDFLRGKKSIGDLKSTYKPGVVSARMDKLLPSFIVESLQAALVRYNQKMQGFITDDALIAGVESKTSSPIMLPRGKDLQSVSHPGLFPTGEGAGYAGGIVSAALDGVRVAQSVLTDLQSNTH